MDKKQLWVQQLLGVLYVVLLSLLWFNALKFLYQRFDTLYFPEVAMIWLMITACIMILPLPYLSSSQRNIWFIVTLIVGVLSGYLLYGQILSIFILVAGVTWVSVKKVVDGIGAREFIALLATTLILYGLLFFYSFIFTVGKQEVAGLIRFFILSFFISMIGIVINQLMYQEGTTENPSFYRQWGIFNGVIWGAIGIIALVSAILLFAVLGIIPLVGWLITTILSPILKWIFSLAPYIQEIWRKLLSNRESTVGEPEEFQNQIETTPLSPTTELIWNIILSSILIALICFGLYVLIKYVRKVVKARSVSSKPLPGASIIIEKSDSSPEDPSSWLNKLYSYFRPYRVEEEHPIRKEFRNMLILMRKKGIWNRDSMTVYELNQLISKLEYSSILYEKLRYGDQNLSDEEIVRFRDELKKIINEIKDRD